jgi:serine/threonine protein kinase
MLEQSSDQHRLQFFERAVLGPSGRVGWTIKQQQNTSGSTSRTSSGSQTQQQSQQKTVSPSQNPQASLMEVIRAETHRKKKYPPSETGNSPRNYELFVDLIHKMLAYDPRERITPLTALEHPFVTGPAT